MTIDENRFDFIWGIDPLKLFSFKSIFGCGTVGAFILFCGKFTVEMMTTD